MIIPGLKSPSVAFQIPVAVVSLGFGIFLFGILSIEFEF